MPNRSDRRAAKKGRSYPLPDAAADHLFSLMTASNTAAQAYMDAAQNIVRGMNLGAPKEGYRWVVDPTPAGRKVSEQR